MDKIIEYVVDDIVIIGMLGQFLKVNSVMEFWDNIIYGKNCIFEVLIECWDWCEFVLIDIEE